MKKMKLQLLKINQLKIDIILKKKHPTTTFIKLLRTKNLKIK
jgi:hypothetical protein